MKQSLRHITLVLTGIFALTTTLTAASERTSSPMTGLNSRDALPSIQDTASDWTDTLALNHEEAHQDLDLQTTSSTTTTIIAEGSRRLLMDETAQPKDKKRKARKIGQTPNRKDSTGHTDTTGTLLVPLCWIVLLRWIAGVHRRRSPQSIRPNFVPWSRCPRWKHQ